MYAIAYDYFQERDYRTLGQLAYNAYNRNKLDITVIKNYWYFETCANNKIYNFVQKRMKEEFPHLKYLT